MTSSSSSSNAARFSVEELTLPNPSFLIVFITGPLSGGLHVLLWILPIPVPVHLNAVFPFQNLPFLAWFLQGFSSLFGRYQPRSFLVLLSASVLWDYTCYGHFACTDSCAVILWVLMLSYISAISRHWPGHYRGVSFPPRSYCISSILSKPIISCL